MCGDFGPPSDFHHVNVGQYSDDEICEYIKHLSEFMIDRRKVQKAEPLEPEFTVEDIPF